MDIPAAGFGKIAPGFSVTYVAPSFSCADRYDCRRVASAQYGLFALCPVGTAPCSASRPRGLHSRDECVAASRRLLRARSARFLSHRRPGRQRAVHPEADSVASACRAHGRARAARSPALQNLGIRHSIISRERHEAGTGRAAQLRSRDANPSSVTGKLSRERLDH